MLIGVISDTHGLMRPEALDALRSADYILHVGDVGDTAILSALRTIAPVTAVRGNIDRAGECALLPATEFLELGGINIYMLHDLAELDLDPKAAGVSAIISGHSHKPKIAWNAGILYLNPGSAGPRRFSLPVSVGLLEMTDGEISARLVDLTNSAGP